MKNPKTSASLTLIQVDEALDKYIVRPPPDPDRGLRPRLELDERGPHGGSLGEARILLGGHLDILRVTRETMKMLSL